MPTIWYKKQQLGKWRRDDGESKNHVSEESMYREIGILILNGWDVKRHGVTHTRMYELSKGDENGGNPT